MRRARLLFVIGVVLLLAAMSHRADALVTGLDCANHSHNGKRVDVCAYVSSFANGADSDDNDRAVGAVANGATQGKVEFDYVHLWLHTFFPDGYILRAARETNFTFARGTAYTLFTPDAFGFNCRGAGQHSRLHTEARYRITWGDGVVGPWRIFNSIERECQV